MMLIAASWAVEQARRGDEAHLVRRPVLGQRLVFGGKIGHGVSPLFYSTRIAASSGLPGG